MYEGNVVIFAEKPMMARELAKPFEPKKVNNYTYEILPNKLFPQGAIVLSAISQLYGPLLTYWENGPVTEKFKLVKKERLQVEELGQLYGHLLTEVTKEHLNAIKTALNQADVIIDAIDHEEVGDAIFELFYKFSGTKSTNIFKYKGYSLLDEEIIRSYERAEKINSINETEDYMQPMLSFLTK